MNNLVLPLLGSAIFLGGCVAASKPVPATNSAATNAGVSAGQPAQGLHYGRAVSLPGPAPADPLDNYLWQYFNTNQGKAVCLDPGDTLAMVRGSVSKFVLRGKKSGKVTNGALATAGATLYPCPFSPYRMPTRAAVPADLVGKWMTPDESQLLRLAPKLGQDKMGPLPVRCEAFKIDADGLFRSVVLAGKALCTKQQLSRATVVWQQAPARADWRPVFKSRIRIQHHAAKNHSEDWDVHVVTQHFRRYGVAFLPGDLLVYLRKTGADDRSNVSSLFRHLRRFAPGNKSTIRSASFKN